ncbi:MAG: hypothetical protein LUQ31_05515 [Methanoregula sp.]|nr:hypothetical protein [Methanoregula sp.]
MEYTSSTFHADRRREPARARGRAGKKTGRPTAILLIIIVILIALQGTAGAAPDNSVPGNATTPQIVKIGIDVMDFNGFSVADGTAETNFYLSLRSDEPVSLENIELMNGQITSVYSFVNTSGEKTYRIYATITADPDLRLFPFDQHTLPIIFESKNNDVSTRVLVIDTNRTGIDPEADLPGWQFTRNSAYIMNKSYDVGGEEYSRAVFTEGIERDTASTLLKFFLPIMLIVIVSLSSLLMKVSSRLGLNASMFLAAVLIHWRVADAIPLVAYATFLDIFMIITYATLVMVLVSGILIMKFNESRDTVRIGLVDYWSLRIIPVLSLTLYFLLFLTLVI